MIARPVPPGGVGGPAEVVAALVPGGDVDAVAHAAVELSQESDAPIRFVCLSLAQRNPRLPRSVADPTFDKMLHCLARGNGHRVAFEYADGDPQQALLQRSRGALVLVLEADDVENPSSSPDIAAFCLAHASCPVHIVEPSREQV